MKRLVGRQEEKSSRERANHKDRSALGFLTLGILAHLGLRSTSWRAGSVHLMVWKSGEMGSNHWHIIEKQLISYGIEWW